MTSDIESTAVEPQADAGIILCTICRNPMRKLWSCNGYCYYACDECRFVRVAPVPQSDVLKDYYSKVYEVDREGYRRNIRRHGRKDLRVLEGINGRGRMLEVGCSWGFFLEDARVRGWHVQGIELSDSAAMWAKEKLGLDVTSGTIEDSLLSEEPFFDSVVAWHVIEHVQDPINFLRIVRDRLRPGGLLALRTPNIRSLPARLNGWAWQWVGAPAHLSLFSPKSLELALERAGFRVSHVVTRRGDAYNPIFEVVRGSALRLGLHQQMKELFKLRGTNPADSHSDDGGMTAVRRMNTLQRLSKLFDIAFFLLYPFEKLSDFAACGPEMFLVAERKD